MSSQLTPEQEAREVIDAALTRAGWIVQSKDQINLFAGRGVAVREMKMKKGHGYADYILFVDAKAVGALEAKRPGVPLTGAEGQARKYSDGLPPKLSAPIRPLPFLYTSTGVETRFVNRLDPHPRSRRVFAPHRPETLAEWLAAEPLPIWASNWAATGAAETSAPRPATLRSRLRAMPSPDDIPGLWPNQLEAVANLEKFLAQGRERALIQMATGSGKSLTAVASIYRLIKFGGARRVLFLVDRNNLSEQAEREFQSYRCYDDNRKFTEHYTVQRLSSGTIRSAGKVVITTIQRLYAMLRGEPDADTDTDTAADHGPDAEHLDQPVDVAYNPAIPPEHFDVIFIDECHRSIYTVWRQVIEYFDAFLIGLTATPAKHTFGFFRRNLVMEYNHERAVADGVNVDFDIYRIRTRITEQGATIEAAPGVTVGVRERGTRALRWEQPDEDIAYTARQLDREVVARDQIRLIVRTFKERLFRDIFPGRTHVPKTLIFAKDDSHAEDIVDIVREEFGQGDDFCKKITYRVSGADPKDLIQELRTGYNPRIAVTVDMIATGTDVRCIEIVMFLRSVKSRTLYEQMKGRGVRVISRDELLSVTPDADAKTRFVLVDCVGVTESDMQDSRPLERKPGVSFKKLLEHVAYGGTDADTIASLASRLTRLDRQCSPEERRRIQDQGGVSLSGLVRGLVEALDPDAQDTEARRAHGLGEGQAPTPAQLQQAAGTLIQAAVAPLATQPALRDLLENLKKQHEQIIDEVSMDQLIAAGPAVATRDRAHALVQSFEIFLEEHRDEIAALQVFYDRPYGQRLRYADIKALAEAIQAPPRQWTPARLWQAYEQLDKSRVRGASGQRLLTDVVSLVRFALHQSDELVPYAQQIQERFDNWMAQQANTGRRFTDEQVTWLQMMRDHVAQSLEIDMEDFDYTPFVEHGGLGRAAQVFGNDLARLLGELNEALAA